MKFCTIKIRQEQTTRIFIYPLPRKTSISIRQIGDFFYFIAGPPRLSMNSSNMTDIKSALHEIALLTAVIEAFPVPTSDNFTWSKCDEESVCQTLQTNKSYIVHVERLQTDLIIKDVKSSDYGQYKLTVSNGIDNPLQVMFHLSQLGKTGQSSMRYRNNSNSRTCAKATC